MDIYRQVKDILKSSGLAVDEVGEIEKGYTKTIIVPPTGKKHGYTYQRTYDGIEGKGNKSRQSCNRDNIQTEFKNRIDSTEIRNLAICSDSDFSKYVDDMFNRNYRNIPSVIRMPDLNGKLTQKLHLANVYCYMLKERFSHINPKRNGRYNQDFRIEEYKEIPKIIRNAKIALYSNKLHNFSVFVEDKQDSTKINTVAFNKDINGNYLVTVGKKDKSSFGEGEFKIVGVGVAPTIHEIKKSRPTTSLLASPTYSENIPYNFFAVNKSLNEQVKDILKSSGLSVGCEDVERASVGRERVWNIQKTNFLFGDDWENIIKSHQYSRKEFKNGSWRYYYDKHDSFSRMTQCKSVPLKISASMSARDIVLAATDYIQNVWLADWKQNPCKAICKELKGKVISFESISYKHLGNTGRNSKGGKQFRSIQNLIDHVRYLPLAKELLENNGIHTQSRYEEFDSPKSDGSIGLVYQTVSGIAPNGDTNNYVQVTVSQKKYKGGELGGTVYISVIGTKDIKKSLQKQGFLTTSRCVRQGCESYPATDKTIPLKTPVVNKSILFEFTDLTPNNRKDKIEKAVRILSKQLGVPVAVERLHEHKGEAFAFKAQEELTYKWADYLNNATKEVYDFVCAYFDLPVQNILQKADVLRHKGQILYSPEIGKPIKKSDWDNFVKALEKILNRKYGETGKKIVLDSQSLGRLLDRMLKYNKLPEVKDVKLSDIRYSGKSFSYIAESARNAEKVFGAIDNARLELLEQSAAERITGVTEQMKHDIKQVLIDGVKSRKGKQQISQDLFNKLTGTNRDFRKIADTEIQNNINNAFLEEEVSNTGEGEKVYFQRMETVDGATCPFCKKMNGVIAVWSETPLSNDKVDGDPYATIALWEGKDWTGQKDYVANGVFHPYCRGLWVRWNARINAYAAMLQKKNEKYNNAVDKAREEWKAKGIENPNDKTPGYVDRINELYNGAIQKSLTWSGHKLQDRYNFAGLKISIENKKGSARSGTDKDGHEWHTYMHYDYGYIRGTEGVDGDHLDCYIGDNENAKNVYIIHQNDPVTHKYDEDKCMLGFNTLQEAKEAYRKQYDRPGFMGNITTMSIEEFKEYVLAKNNHAKRINP